MFYVNVWLIFKCRYIKSGRSQRDPAPREDHAARLLRDAQAATPLPSKKKKLRQVYNLANPKAQGKAKGKAKQAMAPEKAKGKATAKGMGKSTATAQGKATAKGTATAKGKAEAQDDDDDDDDDRDSVRATVKPKAKPKTKTLHHKQVPTPWDGTSELFCVSGSKQSYLQYKDMAGTLRLLVAISNTMSDDHAVLIQRVARFAKGKLRLTKQNVVKYRDNIVQASKRD
jgi:hypothetical protein